MASVNYGRLYPRFWLGYFVLSVAILASNVVFAIASALRPGGVPDLLGLVVGFVGLYPLYGFVRQRRYNPRWLWLFLLVISALGMAAAVGICLFVAIAQLSLLPLAIAVAVVALGGPYAFALREYVFRSPHLWQ